MLCAKIHDLDCPAGFPDLTGGSGSGAAYTMGGSQPHISSAAPFQERISTQQDQHAPTPPNPARASSGAENDPSASLPSLTSGFPASSGPETLWGSAFLLRSDWLAVLALQIRLVQGCRDESFERLAIGKSLNLLQALAPATGKAIRRRCMLQSASQRPAGSPRMPGKSSPGTPHDTTRMCCE